MLHEDRCSKIDENFEYGKTYYFDKSGISISENELENCNTGCLPIVEACCRIQLPKGFRFSRQCPGMCFNLSNLTCIKVPVTQKVTLSNCPTRHPIECEPVVGYEIRAIGDVNFAVSAPISPICGECFPVNSHSCCNSSVCVNEVIGYACCPKPCPKDLPCVDWNLAYFIVRRIEDSCGSYLQVNMGVALEYTGICDCEDE